MMGGLIMRFRALPRALRWLVMAGAVFVLYFIVVEPMLDLTATMQIRADRLATGLVEQAEARREATGVGQALALGTVRYGAVLGPGGPERSGELNARVEQILGEHRVTGRRISVRAGVALGRNAMAGAIPETRQVERIILDIDFESTPETAFDVISAMERAPEIAAVGRVQIRRLDRGEGRLVQVSLSPEAWVLAPKGGRS